MGELSALPNIAVKLEEQLTKAGVTTINHLKEIGSREAWLRIFALDSSACINRLYAIEGAIQGVRWHSLDDGTKSSLKAFYEEHKG